MISLMIRELRVTSSAPALYRRLGTLAVGRVDNGMISPSSTASPGSLSCFLGT